jgi:hypothetical protein
MTTPFSTAKTPLEAAFELLGPNRIARICGVKGPSAIKWRTKGRLPRTEWTGETDYATLIARETSGAVTREQLLSRQ